MQTNITNHNHKICFHLTTIYAGSDFWQIFLFAFVSLISTDYCMYYYLSGCTILVIKEHQIKSIMFFMVYQMVDKLFCILYRHVLVIDWLMFPSSDVDPLFCHRLVHILSSTETNTKLILCWLLALKRQFFSITSKTGKSLLQLILPMSINLKLIFLPITSPSSMVTKPVKTRDALQGRWNKNTNFTYDSLVTSSWPN